MNKYLPMTFEEFDKYIEGLEKEFDWMEKCADIGIDIVYDNISSFDMVVQLISAIFEDTNKTFEWWVYDKNFGRNADLSMWDKDKHIIPTATRKDIYMVLMDKFLL